MIRQKKSSLGETEQCTTCKEDGVDVEASEKEHHTGGRRTSTEVNGVFFKILIVAYIASWVCFYLLVHHNKETKDLSSAPSIILLVDVVKLIFASFLFCKSNGINEFIKFFRNWELFSEVILRYAPIAALYAICDNLMVYNLKNNHPIVYQILSSSRLIMVAIVWQVLFKVTIPQKRKVALGLITIGLIVKCFKNQSFGTGISQKNTGNFLFRTSLVLLQMACSVMASVYNEKMLKHNSCHQFLQNICLYLNSIVINLFIFAFLPNDGGSEPSIISKPTVMIVITLAAAGLMSAMILQSAGSVTKCVATASITIVMCTIDTVFFGYKLVTPEAIAVFFVTMGTALYSLNVDNSIKDNDTTMVTSSAMKTSWRSKQAKQTMKYLSFLVCTSFLSMHTPDLPAQSRHETICTSEIVKQHRQADFGFINNSKCDNLCKKSQDAYKKQYKNIQEAEAMVAYIVEKLSVINAPVSIIYRTLLHEYRNGTSSCVLYDKEDNDLDIALFEPHFHAVVTIKHDLEAMFGWKVLQAFTEEMIMVLMPPDQTDLKQGYQLVIYGFKINQPEKGMLYFPSKNITYSMHGFLPLVKHKTIAYIGTSDMRKKDLYLYTPYNVSCNLMNQFGSNFMTPDESANVFYRRDAYNQPVCEQRNMTSIEVAELDRQLQFVGTFFGPFGVFNKSIG